MGAANARREMLLNKAKRVGYSKPPRYLCHNGQWYDLRSGNPVKSLTEALHDATKAFKDFGRALGGINRDLPWEGSVIR